MDWAKAKFILIIAFIITNMFLGYSYYKTKSIAQNEHFSDGEYREYVQMLLEKKNIELKVKVPEHEQRLGPILVKYEMPDKDMYKTLVEDKGAVYEFEGANKSVLTFDAKLKKYDVESAIDYANGFLKLYELNGRGIKLKKASENPEYIEVVYAGDHDGYFLEKSYMSFKFQRDGSLKVERLWLIPEKSIFQKRMLISPYEAIVKIYPELDDSSVISDISLGYYFKLGENLNIKDTKTAKAFPAWRITLSDGTEKYVSALDF
ncbi:MAG: hypothetical protein GT589_01105 [Peptoclostridium sp.]|uniref:two-component system regulatory protein YycI n=1 Tax=Peptoclostridium sp. TaxID=1904860 RepID=UPI00139BB6C0|nr:two-component system regulatory protein YycI [Peptoclostridium sp.]MZQ74742.1 hypothetical protein [Peptoclostridium sp.]